MWHIDKLTNQNSCKGSVKIFPLLIFEFHAYITLRNFYVHKIRWNLLFCPDKLLKLLSHIFHINCHICKLLKITLGTWEMLNKKSDHILLHTDGDRRQSVTIGYISLGMEIILARKKENNNNNLKCTTRFVIYFALNSYFLRNSYCFKIRWG